MRVHPTERALLLDIRKGAAGHRESGAVYLGALLVMVGGQPAEGGGLHTGATFHRLGTGSKELDHAGELAIGQAVRTLAARMQPQEEGQ